MTIESQIMKVKDRSGTRLESWPSGKPLPNDSKLGIGIPRERNKTVAIAFCGGKSGIPHSILEPIAAPARTHNCISANLLDQTLHVLTLSQDNIKFAEEHRLSYVDPSKLVTDVELTQIAQTVGATKYIFTEDVRLGSAIRQTLEKNANEIPTGGIELTKWRHANRAE